MIYYKSECPIYATNQSINFSSRLSLLQSSSVVKIFSRKILQSRCFLKISLIMLFHRLPFNFLRLNKFKHSLGQPQNKTRYIHITSLERPSAGLEGGHKDNFIFVLRMMFQRCSNFNTVPLLDASGIVGLFLLRIFALRQI